LSRVFSICISTLHTVSIEIVPSVASFLLENTPLENMSHIGEELRATLNELLFVHQNNIKHRKNDLFSSDNGCLFENEIFKILLTSCSSHSIFSTYFLERMNQISNTLPSKETEAQKLQSQSKTVLPIDIWIFIAINNGGSTNMGMSVSSALISNTASSSHR
jgi:hypothetical protein